MFLKKMIKDEAFLIFFLITNQSVKIGTYDISFELQTKSSSDVKVSAVLRYFHKKDKQTTAN